MRISFYITGALHNSRCQCGNCQRLNRVQECVCCLEIDCVVATIQLFPEGEVNSGGYIPTLRGIVVLVFTKSDG